MTMTLTLLFHFSHFSEVATAAVTAAPTPAMVVAVVVAAAAAADGHPRHCFAHAPHRSPIKLHHNPLWPNEYYGRLRPATSWAD